MSRSVDVRGTEEGMRYFQDGKEVRMPKGNGKKVKKPKGN